MYNRLSFINMGTFKSFRHYLIHFFILKYLKHSKSCIFNLLPPKLCEVFNNHLVTEFIRNVTRDQNTHVNLSRFSFLFRFTKSIHIQCSLKFNIYIPQLSP